MLAGRRKYDTEPELLLRRALHAAGARFRTHVRIAADCMPDLVLRGRRIAVWVDGDFWHGCPEHGRRTPFTGPNAELWTAKLARTQARDVIASEVAQAHGWTVVRLWECTVRADPAAAAERVLAVGTEEPIQLSGERASTDSV
jgi:DNA mismatch endonuclease (patch repair protein)